MHVCGNSVHTDLTCPPGFWQYCLGEGTAWRGTILGGACRFVSEVGVVLGGKAGSERLETFPNHTAGKE